MAPESPRRIWRFEQKENRLMTRLMAAALAATLMCGATAFAQDMPSGGQPAPAQPAAPAAADQSSAPPAPAASDQSAAPAQAPAPATDANVVSNAPSGQPPSSYPPCTHKGEDRCVARGGGGEGHKAMHHHKAKKADAASEAPAGA